MSVSFVSSNSRANRISRRLLLLVSLAILLAILTTTVGTPTKAQESTEDPLANILTWQTQRVTNTKLFSWMGSRHMRLDSTGKAHVAYGGDQLYYAYYDGANWAYQTVDTGRGVGLYASLALDSANHPHISYYDANTGSLKYARNLGSGWEKFILDTPAMASAYEFAEGDNPSLEGLPERLLNVKDWTSLLENPQDVAGSESAAQVLAAMQGRGLYTSIAMDSSNNPHIAYYDSVNGDLKYAHKIFSNWRIDAIETTGDVGQYAALAVAKDSNNRVFAHFSYYDAISKDLHYARWSEETMSIVERISVDGADRDIGMYSSIALTNNTLPQPRISYYDATNKYLKYAIGTIDSQGSSTWERMNVITDGDNGQYTSLALDSYNTPRISYLNVTDSKLMLATYSNTSWGTQAIQVVANSGLYSSLALDGSANANISFYDASKGELRFAKQTGTTSWNITVTDGAANLGAYNSLAFDSAGNPHISFFDDTHDDLLYTYWNGTAWAAPSVVEWNGDVGLYNDIVIGAGNIPHIAYFDANRECLRYAYWDNGWKAEDADPTKKTGKYASIALDSNNQPFISYFDETNGDLKLAYKQGGVWARYTVDTGNGDIVGLYTSLAINKLTNEWHISYYNQTTGYLRYAFLPQGSGTWKVETMVRKQAGMFSQIALDNQGFPHVAFLDDFNEDTLIHAWKTGTTNLDWNFETVDKNTHLISTPIPPIVPLSIAVDANNVVHVSYYDYYLKALHYARKANNAWQLQVIDANGDDGQYSSIAVNAAGEAGISYYDASTGDLMYAKSVLLNLPYNLFLPILIR